MIDKPERFFERRRFVRVNGTFVVSYNQIEPEPKADISQTKNISEGGILFTADKFFKTGSVLQIKIRLPDASDYSTIKVQVVDSVQLVKDFMYDTRAKFLDIRPEERALIRKIVALEKEKKG